MASCSVTMTSSQRGDDCQSNDSNNLFPIAAAAESLRFPLDSSMQIVFTGHYNGFNVEVRSTDEMTLMYHMGCFGKGSVSKSKPRIRSGPVIMRKRQFSKRVYWHKKFGGSKHKSELDKFRKDIKKVTAKILYDCKKEAQKDIIDLVSSDEDNSNMSEGDELENLQIFDSSDKTEMVVVVPNSDSEDDYMANLKPKGCINKVNLQEKLMLTLQEAFFLTYALGCLQVIDNDKMLNIEQCWELFIKTDVHFLNKYVVYHYYKSKGYVVKPAIKYGGDYLLYKEGPAHKHADYIVVIRDNSLSYDWVPLLGHVRMATTTVKEILIAEVIEPKEREDLKLPQDLNKFTIRELLLNRNISIINDDEDDDE